MLVTPVQRLGGTVVLVLLLASLCYMLTQLPHPMREFDSKAWIASAHTNARIFMLPDLMQHYQLVGKSREQLVELLGEPDADKGDGIFEYDMGKTGKEDSVFVVRMKNDRVVRIGGGRASESVPLADESSVSENAPQDEKGQ